MTKITHSVRFFLKNEQEGGQFLDSPSHLFFVTELGGSAVEKATVPSASAQGPVSYSASPSLPKSIMIRSIDGKHTNKKAKK